MKIVQHCFGSNNSGGPIVSYLREIQFSKRKFTEMRQIGPAGIFNIKLLIDYIVLLRKTNPDIIHIRGLGNEGFYAVLAAKLADVPVILVTIHGTHRDILFPKSKIKKFIVVNFLERLTLTLCTHIATVCKYAANREFLKYYKKKFIGVVHNGVPIPTPNYEVIKSIKIQHNISNSIIGICVSRITIEKGFYVLFEALKLIDEKIENFVILIAGGGDDDGSIRKMYSSLKSIRVVFLGQINNVIDYLMSSDFFIFPSLHENNSNALLEAMSCGLPVIASDVGGNIEVLSSGGGALVPAGSAMHLADQIFQYYKNCDELQGIGSVGQLNIINNFSIEKMIDGWDSVYCRLYDLSRNQK